jgi:hypothetical protein
MKLVFLLIVFATAFSCGEPASQAPSPSTRSSPENIGTATLSETSCDFAMSDRLPMHDVRFALVNQTGYIGHYIFLVIHEGHVFQDLIDGWNSGVLKQGAPSWITEIRDADVPAKGTGEIVAPVAAKGIYAFHCGYADQTGKVTGFWHELHAG